MPGFFWTFGSPSCVSARNPSCRETSCSWIVATLARFLSGSMSWACCVAAVNATWSASTTLAVHCCPQASAFAETDGCPQASTAAAVPGCPQASAFTETDGCPQAATDCGPQASTPIASARPSGRVLGRHSCRPLPLDCRCAWKAVVTCTSPRPSGRCMKPAMKLPKAIMLFIPDISCKCVCGWLVVLKSDVLVFRKGNVRTICSTSDKSNPSGTWGSFPAGNNFSLSATEKSCHVPGSSNM